MRKDYGAHCVFHNVSLTLKRGEKVAFVGRNGEGKSTLVKCIMGEIPFEGTLKVGHNVLIGYYAQNQAQMLDGELTVFDTIDRVAKATSGCASATFWAPSCSAARRQTKK